MNAALIAVAPPIQFWLTPFHPMTLSEFDSISILEGDLWSAADNLRANSKLTSSEYCMPVLGIIFLRHASNRYEVALKQIQDDQASGKIPKRKLVKADFIKRCALMLPEEARYTPLFWSKSHND